MILEDLTKQRFGYTSDFLTQYSSKKIVVACDYCGKEKEMTMKNRNKYNQVIPKDSCRSCKFKKMEEMGKSNPFSRPETKAKIKETCREKYGVDTFTQTQEFKDKTKATMLKKYGVEHAAHSEAIQQARKNTNLERYGVEHVLQLKEVREKGQKISRSQDVKDKIKKTCQEKYGTDSYLASEEGAKIKQERVREIYGVDNVFQSEEIKAKIRQTNQEKLGVDYPQQSKEIREKSKQTNLERYGVENVFQSEKIKNIAKETSFQRYGVEYPAQSKDIKEKTRQTCIDRGYIHIYQGKDMAQWAEELGILYTTLRAATQKYGLEGAINHEPNTTYIEQKIKDLLDSLQIQYEFQYRVDKCIADFYIPSANLIIEVDGLYWHCDAIIENDDYHINKKALYDKHGFRSLFFREDEIKQKFDVVASIIKNKLGLSEKIYARNCELLKNIPHETALDFFNKNHLMGAGVGICHALIHNNIIVAAAQIKRIRGANYEISRFAVKSDLNIVGGFSKLISKYEGMDSLTTFIDRRYGEGRYLESLGFAYKGCHKSFRWTDGTNTYHRMKFPSNSGYDQLCFKLWDCGQARFTKVY